MARTKQGKRELAIGMFTGYAAVMHQEHGFTRDELVALIDAELAETEFTGKLSGQTVDHLRHDTSWGRVSDGGPPENATALAKILDAPLQKRGFGWQITVSLTRPEAEALIQHLDLAAGVVEGMTYEERSGDTAYRAMRKDCEKWEQIINGGDR